MVTQFRTLKNCWSKMKTIRVVGWVFCFLLGGLFIASALFKFAVTPEQFAEFPPNGWEHHQIFTIGVIELVSALIFVIPTRISFLGLVLLTGYMGGAVATHVRIGEMPIPQVVIGVLLWIAYSMAHPEVFMAAFRIPPRKPADAAD